MSKVTRDGIIRTMTSDTDSAGVSDARAMNATPPPRKRPDLNATITLSEDALAELLAEVKNGRTTGEREEIPAAANSSEPTERADGGTATEAGQELSHDRSADRAPEWLPERAPAQPVVPQWWKRAEGASKRKF